MSERILRDGDRLRVDGHIYLIVGFLGKGGFAEVYLAEERGQQVALKILLPKHAATLWCVDAFKREGQLQGLLSHSHIVRVLGSGRAELISRPGHHLAIVMEYLPGGSLWTWVHDHGPLPVDSTIALGRQVALALLAAAALRDSFDDTLQSRQIQQQLTALIGKERIIHRDVTPQNILLDATGEVAKLGDWGISKRTLHTLTTNNTRVFNPLFASPELVNPDPKSRIGPSSDIYQLGATLYWCLTGRAPSQTNHQRLRELRPEVPEVLENLICRMLDEEPQARPTAEEVIDWLEVVPWTLGTNSTERAKPGPVFVPWAYLSRVALTFLLFLGSFGLMAMALRWP